MGEPNLTTENKPEPEGTPDNSKGNQKISPNYKGKRPWNKNNDTYTNKYKQQLNKFKGGITEMNGHVFQVHAESPKST